jgi:hypothetical protein
MPVPSFPDAASLARDPKWSSYLDAVYGPLPAAAFPLDLSRFDVFYAPLLASLAIDLASVGARACPKPGEMFEDMSSAHDPPGTLWAYHAPPYAATEPQTWVEVTHCADPKARAQEQLGAWFYRAVGSGIFINTGNTKVYSDHPDAVKDLLGVDCRDTECSGQFPAIMAAAKAKGYDSIQFLAHGDQRCGLTAIEIVTVAGSGALTCSGVAARRGWGASKACDCDRNQTCLNCGVDFPIAGSCLQPVGGDSFSFRDLSIALGVLAGLLLVSTVTVSVLLCRKHRRRPGD